MTESGLIMKKSKLLPLLLAFLMLGLLSSSAVASIFLPIMAMNPCTAALVSRFTETLAMSHGRACHLGVTLPMAE